MSQYTTKSRKLRLQLTCTNQNWKDWKNHHALYEVFRWWCPFTPAEDCLPTTGY